MSARSQAAPEGLLARRRVRSRRGHRPGSQPLLNALYILPALIMIAIFFYGAIAFGAVASLQDWNFLSTPEFVGVENYQKVAADAIFLKTLANTIVLVVISLFLQSAIGFVLAILVTANVRFVNVYKTLFFIPVVLSPAILAYVFRRFFDPNGGMSNFMDGIGLGMLWQPWLAFPSAAIYAVAAMVIWSSLGFAFMMYVAGLTHMDKETVEAARIDGANTRQLVRHVVFPLLKSTHATLLILGVATAVGIFDIVFIATEGGPARATEVIATLLYKVTIIQFKGGYAAAISMVVLVGALAVTVLIRWWLADRSSRGAQ
jgi:raffinose/stachyose/melibiose transport system permease protein